MTPAEVEGIARKAALDGVRDAIRDEMHDLFRAIGVDIKDQGSLNRLRADLIYARELREFKDTAKRRFWFVVVSVAVLAAVSAFWEGIKVKMGW